MRSKETVWPSGLRRQFQVLVTCGVGSNPTTVTSLFSISHGTREREEKRDAAAPPLSFSFFSSGKRYHTPFVLAAPDREKGFAISFLFQSEKVFYCSPSLARAREREETNEVNNNISSRVAVGLFSR